jgi:hypothetical protein
MYCVRGRALRGGGRRFERTSSTRCFRVLNCCLLTVRTDVRHEAVAAVRSSPRATPTNGVLSGYDSRHGNDRQRRLSRGPVGLWIICVKNMREEHGMGS